jgi:hypothetical protein
MWMHIPRLNRKCTIATHLKIIMTNGVLIFKGMNVGVLEGDFSISVDENGTPKSNLVLSTSYNVIPIWLRVASDNLVLAKLASENIKNNWTDVVDHQKSLLILELSPSMQVIIACGIALDALYDMLRPHAKLTNSDINKWKINKTSRAKQIIEVIRRVYKLNGETLSQFKNAISQIIKFRDMGVHPSSELKNTCTRPDLSVGIDWKFSAYRYSNAQSCFDLTTNMMKHLHNIECKEKRVIEDLKNIFLALDELNVIKSNTN